MDITKALLLALVVIGIGLLCLVWLCFIIFIIRLIKTARSQKNTAELEKENAELKAQVNEWLNTYSDTSLVKVLRDCIYKNEKLSSQEQQQLSAWVECAMDFGSNLDECIEHLPQWHDLRKNPDDLPNTDDKEHEYVVSDNLGCRMLARYYCGKWSNYGLIDNVIAWCELPTFKE